VIDRKAPWRIRRRVIVEKKLPTALSQEAEVGEIAGPARMASQPNHGINVNATGAGANSPRKRPASTVQT
jgi:hypothetical protein